MMFPRLLYLLRGGFAGTNLFSRFYQFHRFQADQSCFSTSALGRNQYTRLTSTCQTSTNLSNTSKSTLPPSSHLIYSAIDDYPEHIFHIYPYAKNLCKIFSKKCMEQNIVYTGYHTEYFMECV